MYKVSISRRGQQDIETLNKITSLRIQEKILSLETNPRPIGSIKLKNILYRIRVGNWRILYAIEDKRKTITILRIVKRNEQTYKNI